MQFVFSHIISVFRLEKCSCTSLDTLEGDIASIGEDGNVNILNGRRGDISQTIKGADSCSLHSICFIKLNEVPCYFTLILNLKYFYF